MSMYINDRDKNRFDDILFIVGSKCIIEIDDVNSPTGFWWGTISSVTFNENVKGWYVKATITEGRFTIGEYGTEIYSNEFEGREPSVNYTLYPRTKQTIELVWDIIRNNNRKNQEILELRKKNLLLEELICKIKK